MTLKEKIADKYIWTTEPIVDIEEVNNSINKMEQIADEFAIDFAEWFLNESTKPGFFLLEDSTYRYKHKSSYTNKELLEIFKKEKGL